jgi:Cu-processing system permease protein
MDATIVLTLFRKEFRDSFSNRWFVLYVAAFAGLALILAWLSRDGVAGFSRVTASLVNLVLLIVPLMALTVGAGSLAGEHERGTLRYLLSQPVARSEVLAGKYLGLAAALLGAMALGFGLPGLVIAGRGAEVGAEVYLLLAGLAFVLALGMLSVGFLIGALARKMAVANSVALFVWLAFVFVGDLGLMGSTLAFKLPIHLLFNLALLNPLQAFKMAALIGINATLDVLGPAGIYAMQTYGGHLTWLFLLALGAWVALPLLAAYIIFAHRGDL